MPKKENEKSALIVHYDTIGWSITSFFLIFLGTLTPFMFKWINSKSILYGFLIIVLMFFGFVVARLFLRSQYRKVKKFEAEEKFFKNCSTWVYVIFVALLEIFIGFFLLEVFPSPHLSLILLIVVVILIMVLILVETSLIKYEDSKPSKKNKEGIKKIQKKK